jgi:phage terminase large subunit-like protein
VREGWIETTPGDVVDYDWIEAAVGQDMDHLQVMELAYDPWNATSVSNRMAEEGAPLVEYRQGYVSMNPAMKALEVAIQQGQFNHGGHPVLGWNADNLVARQDPAGNLKPDKAESTEKIDGMVALLMAWYRAQLGQGARDSVYNERGLLTL